MKIYQYVNFSDAEFVNFGVFGNIVNGVKNTYNKGKQKVQDVYNKIVPVLQEAEKRGDNVINGIKGSFDIFANNGGHPVEVIKQGFNDVGTGFGCHTNLSSGLSQKAKDTMDKAPTDDANAYNRSLNESKGLERDATLANIEGDRFIKRGLNGIGKGSGEILAKTGQLAGNLVKSFGNFVQDSQNPNVLDNSKKFYVGPNGVPYEGTGSEGIPIN